MTPVLEAKGVSISFGGLKAVGGFNLSLGQGELAGMIGPNGAGKTTVFNMLTGIYRPGAGSIMLDGRSLVGMRPSEIAEAGLARTFQNIRLFGELSVLDNVRVARHLRTGQSMFGTILRTRASIREEKAVKRYSLALLESFGLTERACEQAKSLPYGDQRRLEIARALATGPRVLLLDEPAAGMNPYEKRQLRQLIRKTRDEFGISILLIEHDMGLVMDICERITVLDHGEIIAVGPPEQVQNDPKVCEAYLGAPRHTDQCDRGGDD